MDLNALTPALLQSGADLPTALTFDDVLLVPRHSHGAAEPGRRLDAG